MKKLLDKAPVKLDTTFQWKPRGGRRPKLNMIHDYPTQT
jgi:hypothetical protein